MSAQRPDISRIEEEAEQRPEVAYRQVNGQRRLMRAESTLERALRRADGTLPSLSGFCRSRFQADLSPSPSVQ